MDELDPLLRNAVESKPSKFFRSIAQEVHTIASQILFEHLDDLQFEEEALPDSTDEDLFTTKKDLQNLAAAFPDWMKDKRKRFDRLYGDQKE